MTELLPLDPDELLTTTRSVRKRLDLERPVPLDVVREALEVALQAPSGSNRQTWHWIVVTDPEKRAVIAEYYRVAVTDAITKGTANGPRYSEEERQSMLDRVLNSAMYLTEVLAQVPVFVIGAIDTGWDEYPANNQAPYWGSLLPAAWSLQLALRARGLGSAWTTGHLPFEKEVATLLGIPDGVKQGVLLPVAYYTGTTFKPASRQPLDEVLHIDSW